MKIEKASTLGFCRGVKRAIKIVEKAAHDSREIATLGPIVHNWQVVRGLEDIGVKSVSSLDEVKGHTVAVTSHGVSPEVIDTIRARNLKILDTTCINVRRAQDAAAKFAREGYHVFIFGESTHPEVKGLLGWAGNNAVATLQVPEIASMSDIANLGIVAQTTQNKQQYADFIKGTIDRYFTSLHDLCVVNTLCEETQKRQKAALELARRSDIMIVIGGSNSANTRKLAELCSPVVDTYLVQTADDIERKWLRGKTSIGVTAGASTPDNVINEVITRLENMTESRADKD